MASGSLRVDERHTLRGEGYCYRGTHSRLTGRSQAMRRAISIKKALCRLRIFVDIRFVHSTDATVRKYRELKMPITISHQPSFGVVGKSAYSIGRGTKTERDEIRVEQNAFKEKQLALQAAQIASGYQSRTAQTRSYEKRAENELDFRKQQYEDEPARALEMGMVQKELLQAKVKWEYSEQQRRDLEKINNGVAWVRQQVAEGKWLPEQAEEAEQQLWQRYNAILPMPKYDNTPSPQELLSKRLVHDKTSGQTFIITADGTPKLVESKVAIAQAKMIGDFMAREFTFDEALTMTRAAFSRELTEEAAQPDLQRTPLDPTGQGRNWNEMIGGATEFEQRINDPNAPSIRNPDGTVSTHKMAWDIDEKGFYVFPTIVNQNGKLVQLSAEDADRYAHKTGELKRFATQGQASAYAAGSWKLQSPYEKEYPDAFKEDGIWKVIRDGKKYRIEEE